MKNLRLLLAGGLLGALAMPLAAQQGQPEGFTMEQTIVQARKRPEALQDIPLSVTAFNGDTVERMYGNNLTEFSKYAPNVQLARQPYAGNALFGGIRGIVLGDSEQSFDPAVGVVIDGVALATNTTALLDTFDIEAVEILRGPQGTLFGRNTIAGVVNVRRSKPTGEFGIKTQLRYGSYNELDLKAVLNFPLGEDLAVKLAAFSDKGDGFQEKADFNLMTGELTGTGNQLDGEDTLNLSARFLWTPTAEFEALLTLDYSDDNSTLSTPTNLTAPAIRGQWDTIRADLRAALTTAAAMKDPQARAQAERRAVITAIDTTGLSGGNYCDLYGTVVSTLNDWVPEVACNTYGSILGEQTGYQYSISAQQFINQIESKAATLEMSYDLAYMEISFIAGYRESDELLDQDDLGAPVEVVNRYRPQESDQLSVELRASSHIGNDLEFQIGLYYLDSSYEVTQSIWHWGALGGSRESGAPPAPDGDAGQDLTAYALFGELYYNLSSKARLTLGGRWTREEKDFFIFQRDSGAHPSILPRIWGCGNLSASQQAEADAAAAAWVAMGLDPDDSTLILDPYDQFVRLLRQQDRARALTCQDSDGSESWSEFTPRVSVDYHINDDLMVYTSYSRGFRSGGWNDGATSPSSIGPYNPETVDSYEAGLKMSLLGGAFQAGLALFRSNYKDKYERGTYAFSALGIETVANKAAKATLSGIEFEARYLLSDNVQLRLALGHVSGEYNELRVPVDFFDRITPQVDTSNLYNFSNFYSFAFTPENTASLGFDAIYPLRQGWGRLLFTGNLSWADKTVSNFGLPDPQGLGRNEFPARDVLDLSVTWEHPWLNVAIFGKNLTEDDNYVATSVDEGIFFFGTVLPGRTWGLELTMEW